MTIEWFLFTQWLHASEKMAQTSSNDQQYWLGKVVGYCEAMAHVKDVTFVEASRILMDMQAGIAA
jgi:hypothetical protein